ncbi:hypothetical protein KKA53_04340 [Candidatus Dependentiae bacterium]|nr:hypothetical protein [Candidatus Dependentiae bacterium]
MFSSEARPQGHFAIMLSTKSISSHLVEATVVLSAKTIQAIYKQAAYLYAKSAQPQGLKNITLPLDFIEKELADRISCNVKNFALKHIVIDYLLNQISNKKISVANHPRLINMTCSPNVGGLYTFELSVASPIPLKEWKLFTFKSPKRKRYKDLDKQVDLFIKREHDKFKKQDQEVVENNDWVNFEATITDDCKKPILPHHGDSTSPQNCIHRANFWIKINVSHLEKPFHMNFIGKKAGDSFTTSEIPTDEEFYDTLTARCCFLITIKSLAKGSHLSVEAFRTIFKLKNKAETHNKLIEVFSYRNDISQRRSIVEEVFHLFFSKHRFEIPKHLTIRKQESLLDMLRKQPDYQVYKSQKDFHEKVATLAEKLLKEEVLIDQIAHKEGIKASSKDIRHYLTLFNNSRLREFVYFKPAFEPIEESDTPFPESALRQAVLREKTLNHIIYTLTR